MTLGCVERGGQEVSDVLGVLLGYPCVFDHLERDEDCVWVDFAAEGADWMPGWSVDSARLDSVLVV